MHTDVINEVMSKFGAQAKKVNETFPDLSIVVLYRDEDAGTVTVFGRNELVFKSISGLLDAIADASGVPSSLLLLDLARICAGEHCRVVKK